MLVGELSKPKAIDLNLPDNGDIVCGPIACVDTNRIYTILLDDKDRIVTYSGLLRDSSVNPKEIIYGQNGIRKELFSKKSAILEYSTSMGKPKNGPIVIIKPSEKSNFKNLVDILDEMTITKIDTYAIVSEFTPEESKLLASN